MTNIRHGVTALVAAAALTAGGVSLASAATATSTTQPTPAPCAQQQTQLNRAQAKLDWLTKKFAAQAAKVAQDKQTVATDKGAVKAAATKPNPHRQHRRAEIQLHRAQIALHRAQVQKIHLAQAKKAQQKRVAHDTAALNTCLAAAAPTPTSSATPSATPSA